MVAAHEPVEGIGIPWFRPDDYSWLMQSVGAESTFPSSYGEWRLNADALEQQLKSQRKMVVLRVIIEREGFSRWCKAMGVPLSEWSVGAFAAETSGVPIKHVRAIKPST